MILTVLAAGMGSRYGGLKQIDPITEDGNFIIDFSVYDAIRAGFDKVVFIIKREHYDVFRDTIGKRVSKYIRTFYAFQEQTDIPSDCTVPQGRTKPWGTTHAVLAAREYLTEPFAVINSDDFYGRETFFRLAEFLRQPENALCGNYCMVGYCLRNTLTDFGTVSRGECKVDTHQHLLAITERKKIARDGQNAVCLDGTVPLPMSGDTVVSMNCWGFGADAVTHFASDFDVFIHSDAAKELKSECFLPETVGRMLQAGHCQVTVMHTNAVWHGVTYAEDKSDLTQAVQRMILAGEYPEHLWEDEK